jgi:D-amino-acid oxidase
VDADAASTVTVVGAGVVGLTCALALAEAGRPVRVVARELPADTTSAVAAAVWYPYRAYPYDRVLGWARTSYDAFVRLAADDPGAGVRVRFGTELLRVDAPEPWWAAAVPDLARVSDVPAGFVAGWRFASPVVDMSRYLPWLEGRLAAHGVVAEVAALEVLEGIDALDGPGRPGSGEVTAPGGGQGRVVVNCAGLGARELVPDATVEPVRGQVVVCEQVGVEEWVVDDGDGRGPTYVVPRIDDIVVGGTADEGAFDRRVVPETAAAILDRASALVPALRDARVIGHKVGLRPARPAVRLEVEHRAGRGDGSGSTVVHCYGHGGAGVTLSWGCAADVVALVDEAFHPQR